MAMAVGLGVGFATLEPHFFAIRRHLVFTFCVFRDIFLYDTHLPSIWMWLQCALRRFMGSLSWTFYGKKSSVGGGRARRASTRARRARRGLSLRLVGSQASGWWARDTCESFMSRYGAQL